MRHSLEALTKNTANMGSKKGKEYLEQLCPSLLTASPLHQFCFHRLCPSARANSLTCHARQKQAWEGIIPTIKSVTLSRK